ncbi:MAG: hypothetical protein IJT49_08360 [Clostridia bacterium]|nr:hypothetical protein [Clostridia bacterium]
MKRIIIFVLIICSVFLCSCQSSIYDNICAVLGIDNTDYESEAVTAALPIDDENVRFLSSAAKIVCFGDDIITFDSFSDVSGDYVDVVLNYLTGTFYSKYSADKNMMEKFSSKYPELNINTLIPCSDYENTVYTYFGGKRKATVKSTAMYSYLDKIDAFVLVGQVPGYSIDCTVHEAEETEHTYRLTVSFIKNGASAGVYEIIFVKRESGDPYIWRLHTSSKVYAI